MTEVRFKYLHGFRDRHGHARYYFRYRGQRWSIPGPGEEGFAAEYERLSPTSKPLQCQQHETSPSCADRLDG